MSSETWHNRRTLEIEESQNEVKNNTRLVPVYIQTLLLKNRAWVIWPWWEHDYASCLTLRTSLMHDAGLKAAPAWKANIYTRT